MKKYESVNGKVFLLVPVLNERISRHPVRYTARLVYGYLLYRLRKQAGATCTELASHLLIDKETARRATRTLAALGLAARKGHVWQAIEPPEHSRELFRWQKDAEGEWFTAFVYDRTYLRTPDCPFGTFANAMLWRLVKNATPVADLPNHFYIKQPTFLTIKYLARGLQCDPDTARKSLKELQAAGVIHVVHTGGRAKGFQVGIKLLRPMAKWWRDEWKKNTAVPLTARQLFGTPSTIPIVEDVTAQPESTKYLIQRGVPSNDATQATILIEKFMIPPREWKGLFDRVQRDHACNRVEKPEYPRACGRLLLHQLKEYGQKNEDIDRRFRMEVPRTGEERRGEEAVEALKNGKEIGRLLHHLINQGQVALDDGSEVPIRLDWADVEQLVKDSQYDVRRFKASLAVKVFGSTTPVDCTWSRAWAAA